MGIFDHAGEPGVEAGSEDATCRRRAAKESMETLEAEERMKECGSRGELGGVDVVAPFRLGRARGGGRRRIVLELCSLHAASVPHTDL